jgi:hypothetical protein
MRASGRAAVALLLPAALLAGCATVPSGPSVLVLPGTGKSFDRFRVDDAQCRRYALVQIGAMTPEQAAADSVARSAALGTAVGAIAGAAMDGSSGAAAGAGIGLLMGATAGAGAAQVSGYEAQRHYDHAYVQCMYASGHRVPVYGPFTQPTSRSAPAPVPGAPPAGIPPPNAPPPSALPPPAR